MRTSARLHKQTSALADQDALPGFLPLGLPPLRDAPDGFAGAGVTLGRRELALQGRKRIDDLWGLECPISATNGDLAKDACAGQTLDRLVGVDEAPTDQGRCAVDGDDRRSDEHPEEEVG